MAKKTGAKAKKPKAKSKEKKESAKKPKATTEEKRESAKKPKAVEKKDSEDHKDVNQILVDNFTNLQKVLTNLVFKFDELSNNMSKLLQLFEISAKSFAEKYSDKSPNAQVNELEKTDSKYLEKLDSLLNQNKTIAKGIMLMEERIKQRNTPQPRREPETEFGGMIKSKPHPRF